MKDGYRRRQKAEREYIRKIPEIDPKVKFIPIHQKCMDANYRYLVSAHSQGNNFILTSTSEMGLEMYEVDDGLSESMDEDSMSESSKFSDRRLIPNQRIKPFWFPPMFMRFVTSNIVVGVSTGVNALVTYSVEPGHQLSECIECVTVRDIILETLICKLNDREFAVGGIDSQLCIFEHEDGRNLREVKRIWRTHTKPMSSITAHNDIIVTTSLDWTARVWNAKTRNRMAILYHDQEVNYAAISDKYIVTSSRYGKSFWENGELRIYHNNDEFSLVRILRDREQIGRPIFVDDARILFRITGDSHDFPIQRHSILIFCIETESILAQIKVGCRTIFGYSVLSDGRLVAVGTNGCRGVIATLPRQVRKLIKLDHSANKLKVQRRRMCTIM